MEIKYVTNGELCKTLCPFKMKTGTVRWIHRVGSICCKECQHFVSVDTEKQIVVCNADEETK